MRKVKLAIQEVSKTFRVRGGAGQKASLLPVLRQLSFDVYENEVVSLIGESGCGKTTLLRIVQGLVRLDSGTILVDGKRVEGPGRDRGFVFQQATLLPWRTARQNIEFGLELQKVDRAARTRRARELLEARRSRGGGRAISAPALRRHAATHRVGASPCDRSRDLADGRAFQRA